jgi:ribosomal protein S21
MGRAVNVEVTLNQVRGDTNRLIKRFIKKCKRERIIEKYLNSQTYEKPSTAKRRKNKQRKQNARKAELERNKKFDLK